MQPDCKNGSAPDVDADHKAFFEAVHAGNKDFLEVFLAQHPDAARWNTPDGTPPLVLAVGADDRERWKTDSNYYADDEVMELLISYGADVNAKDVQGRTAFLEECLHSQRDNVMDVLLKNGADINAADNCHVTALHIFAGRGYGEDIIPELVKKGAKVDAQDWLGNTPLHVAAGENGLEFTHGHQEAVRKLLDCGASVEVRNNKMRTPLDSANMNRDFEMDGKRPTADIIDGTVKSRAPARPPRRKSEPEEKQPYVPGPGVPPPADKTRFKLKPPSP